MEFLVVEKGGGLKAPPSCTIIKSNIINKHLLKLFHTRPTGTKIAHASGGKHKEVSYHKMD